MRLTGERLRLTTSTLADVSALLPAYNGDAQFNRWIGQPELTLAQVQADMRLTLQMSGGKVWRIADQTDVLVGVAKTWMLSRTDAWIDLLIIRQAFQHQGYGAETATLLETHLFARAAVRRIALVVLVANTPSQAFWERRGYVRGERYEDGDGDEVYEYAFARPAGTNHEA